DAVGNVQGTPTNPQAITHVDASAPTSNVDALPTYSPASFTVRWSGQDNPGGSGIARYSVYVSDNNGPPTLWPPAATTTSSTYTRQDGHRYGCFSVATDNVGNVQVTPTSAQATTQVDAIAPTSSVSVLPTYSPAFFTISWSGQDNNGGSGIAG